MRGSLRLPVSMLPWWLFTLLWTYTAAAMTLTLLFLNHLRWIFQRVRSGAPFDVANALRLRWLGLIVLVLAALNGLSEFVTSLAVRHSLVSERVGLTLAKFSIMKTNKARAIRFSTLETLCREFDCQPGDLLAYDDSQ